MLLFLAWGCRTEKAPPVVTWLQPTTSPTWMADATVPLKFVVSDPPPSRGQTEPAEWRINIQSEDGTMWWSTSGSLPSGPEEGAMPVVDTLSLQWNTPSAAQLPPGTTQLTLSALATDGEGVIGADFTQAKVESVALTSTGLWFVEANNPNALHHLPNGTNDVLSYERPLIAASKMIHLDGQDLLLLGETDLQAWAILGGVPTTEPLWSISPPLVPQTGPLRFIRRAPIDNPGPALAHVGWPDRVQALNADGLTMGTWLLEADEALIDATVLNQHMVCLVRTSAHELRLVRFLRDNGARIGSITWTPEAEGSTGVNGLAWLVVIQGDPTAIESDGTYRRWYQEADGNTGIQSGNLPGENQVSAAGRLESGASWFSRNGTYRIEYDLPQATVHPNPIFSVAEDRANQRLWVLQNPNAGSPNWLNFNASNWSPIPMEPIGLGEATVGTVAHNRPGGL